MPDVKGAEGPRTQYAFHFKEPEFATGRPPPQ